MLVKLVNFVLFGCDFKLFVMDYFFGGFFMIYCLVEIFIWNSYNKIIIVIYGNIGEYYEFCFIYFWIDFIFESSGVNFFVDINMIVV